MSSDNYKIDLNELITEFVNMVSEDAADLSTDPDVKRVKIIKAEGDCPGCGLGFEVFNEE
ncbi:MAG TPA: hypothetical protein PLL26_06215 [Candidatus Dojkabacteria bacterium]|nr:hypothetical protein [Candidatus Dojkabacteria bacterium]